MNTWDNRSQVALAFTELKLQSKLSSVAVKLVNKSAAAKKTLIKFCCTRCIFHDRNKLRFHFQRLSFLLWTISCVTGLTPHMRLVCLIFALSMKLFWFISDCVLTSWYTFPLYSCKSNELRISFSFWNVLCSALFLRRILIFTING